MKNKKTYPAFRKQPQFSNNSSIQKMKVENELYENVLKLLEDNNVVIVHNTRKEEEKLKKKVEELQLVITSLTKENAELKRDVMKLNDNNAAYKQKNAQLNKENKSILRKTIYPGDFDVIYKITKKDKKWFIRSKDNRTVESTSVAQAIKKINNIEPEEN